MSIGSSVGIIYLLAIVYFCGVDGRDDQDKGVLTEDPFLTATHFLPLDDSKEKVPGLLSIATNMATGKKVILVKNATASYGFASTMEVGSYIILSDKMKGTCFADPEHCRKGTMTFSMWLYLPSASEADKMGNEVITKANENGNNLYIVSLGGQSKKSRGFVFVYNASKKMFIASIGSKNYQWMMWIPFDCLPLNKWGNVVFTWVKGGVLTYYLNGSEIQTVKGKKLDTPRPAGNNTLLMISRPNNVESDRMAKTYQYPLFIKDVAMWEENLKPKEIVKIYELIKLKDEKDNLLKQFRKKLISLEKTKKKRIQEPMIFPGEGFIP